MSQRGLLSGIQSRVVNRFFASSILHKRIFCNPNLHPPKPKPNKRNFFHTSPKILLRPSTIYQTFKYNKMGSVFSSPSAHSETQPLLPPTQTENHVNQNQEDHIDAPYDSDDGSDYSNDDNTGRLMYNPTSGIEELELYKKGGFHPVHIGDTLDGGRFTIVHKLGYGGFSTVWLARDHTLEKYVAVRISLADLYGNEKDIQDIHQRIKARGEDHLTSQYVCLPLEHFMVTGANGQHQCTVFPVCGPSIARLTDAGITLGGQEVQRAAFQATQTLAFFSRDVGIGHGDLTSNNILLEVGNLDHLSTEQLYNITGAPVKFPVDTCSGAPLTASAPTYAVEPIEPLKLFSHRTGNIKVIDFGSSYLLDQPPAELGTPAPFRSPELILHNTIGAEADVWALLCVIFEMRVGSPVFECFSGEEFEVLQSMKSTLGHFPRSLLNEEGREAGLDKVRSGGQSMHLRDLVWGLTKTVRNDYRPDTDYAYEAEKISGFEKLRNYFMWAVLWRPWHAKGVLQPATMSDEELEGFLDLLKGGLVYEKEKRPSAEQLLSHPWFSRVFEKPSMEEWKRESED